MKTNAMKYVSMAIILVLLGAGVWIYATILPSSSIITDEVNKDKDVVSKEFGFNLPDDAVIHQAYAVIGGNLVVSFEMDKDSNMELVEELINDGNEMTLNFVKDKVEVELKKEAIESDEMKELLEKSDWSKVNSLKLM